MKLFLNILCILLFATTANAAELTVYADSEDGNMEYVNASWATVRSAGTASYLSKTAQYGDPGVAAHAPVGTWLYSGNYTLGKTFLEFDTSALAGATVTAATLYIYPYNAAFGIDGTMVAVEGSQGATLATDDYDAHGSTSFGTLAFVRATGAYQTISLNASGIAAINTSGSTYICLRDYTNDFLNSAPAGNGMIAGIYYSEYTGTDHDPKLVITYTPPSVSGTLKEYESDVSGSAIDYLVVNRSTGAVLGGGTSEADGTYSVEVGAVEADIYMLDLTNYLTKCIGEQVTGE